MIGHPVHTPHTVRIIGIDPGSRITGYGIIDSDGVDNRFVAGGSIRTREEQFPLRLGEIFTGLKAVLAQHRPTEMAVEEVFMAKNPSSALKLGQARGAAICAGLEFGVSVAEYSTRAIKRSVVGKGSAEKAQVQYMIKLLLKLGYDPGEDEADALAAAVAHAHMIRMERRVPGLAGVQP